MPSHGCQPDKSAFVTRMSTQEVARTSRSCFEHSLVTCHVCDISGRRGMHRG